MLQEDKGKKHEINSIESITQLLFPFDFFLMQTWSKFNFVYIPLFTPKHKVFQLHTHTDQNKCLSSPKKKKVRLKFITTFWKISNQVSRIINN